MKDKKERIQQTKGRSERCLAASYSENSQTTSCAPGKKGNHGKFLVTGRANEARGE